MGHLDDVDTITSDFVIHEKGTYVGHIYITGRSLYILLMDQLINLVSMHRYILGGLYAYSKLLTFDVQNGYFNFIANGDGFPQLPCQNQHLSAFPPPIKPHLHGR